MFMIIVFGYIMRIMVINNIYRLSTFSYHQTYRNNYRYRQYSLSLCFSYHQRYGNNYRYTDYKSNLCYSKYY